MTLRMIGAVLIFGTCTAVGFKMSAAYKNQEHQLEQLIGAFLYINCELTYRLTPLQQQFEQCCKLTSGAVQQFFQRLATELAAQISPNANYCLLAALNNTQGLSPMAVEALSRLGSTLGCFDLDGQCRGVEEALDFCRQALSNLTAEHSSRTRNYQTLGICAGAALAILFI